MAESYETVAARRRSKVKQENVGSGEVFEQAYAIALQLVELRELHGMTQAELAKECGMDQADISRIERGSTSPTTRVLLRITDALNADVRLVPRAS